MKKYWVENVKGIIKNGLDTVDSASSSPKKDRKKSSAIGQR